MAQNKYYPPPIFPQILPNSTVGFVRPTGKIQGYVGNMLLLKLLMGEVLLFFRAFECL